MPVKASKTAKDLKKLQKKVTVLKRKLKKEKTVVKKRKKPVKRKRKGGAVTKAKKGKKKKGWSTGKKIGVGIGAAFGAAAVGYGAYKVGKKVKQQKEGKKFLGKLFESKFAKNKRQTRTMGSWDPKKKRWTGK